MGLLKDLMSKIFSHAPAAAAPAGAPPAPGNAPAATTASTVQTSAPGTAPAAPATASAAPATATAAPPQQVDIAAILNGLAAKNSEKLDWKHSIVDLMKLVGMDSSLSSRKELAADLHYTGDTQDSATMNMWLHKEVLKKLSENGGHVPADLLKK